MFYVFNKLIKHPIHVSVPNIFLNKMCIQRMYIFRNSIQNNELEIKFHTVGTMKLCTPHPSKSLTFMSQICLPFLEFI